MARRSSSMITTLERLTGGGGGVQGAQGARNSGNWSLRGAALAENPPRLSDFLALLAGRVPLCSRDQEPVRRG